MGRWVCGVVAAVCAAVVLAREPLDKPNIVIMFADDMGYGDPSFNGHPTVTTPNLDALLHQGMRLTSWYSAAPVCTPSRGGIMTGRLPQRLGLWPCVLGSEAEYGLPLNETTLAEALRPAGYATGIVGKWHLGQREMYLPTSRGFDEYLGIPYSVDMQPQVLFLNDTIIQQPADHLTLAPKYAAFSREFIKRHASRPFLFYLPFSHVHTPVFADAEWKGTSKRGLFGDAASELDWIAGEVVNEVREQNLMPNTIFFFTSDNGPWLIQGLNGGSLGQFVGQSALDEKGEHYFDTGKYSTWEGGMREPGFAMWEGQISPTTMSSEPVTSMDIFLTALRLAGVQAPTDRVFDGKDMWPVLQGGKSTHDGIFMYRDTALQAARQGSFKAHYITRSGYGRDSPVAHNPPLLFNIDWDPSEAYPISPSSAEFNSTLEIIDAAVARHNAHMFIHTALNNYSDPKYRPCCDHSKSDCACNRTEPLLYLDGLVGAYYRD